MDSRKLLFCALFAAGMTGIVGPSATRADTIATADGIAVRPSDVATPSRGMSMTDVAAKFGAPATKVPAVGKPPIERWEYPGFVVYFEYQHVIHTVVANS